jgi:formylglycine-generating enzyme
LEPAVRRASSLVVLALLGCQLVREQSAASKPAPSENAPAPVPTRTARVPPPPCPPGMVVGANVCIDVFEAHLVERGSAGAFTPHPHFERPVEGIVYEARSERGVKPQAYISRNESAAACANAGKRLCSVTEWYRSCRGRGDTIYPYGPKYQSGRCNVGRPHLLTRFFGPDPNNWSYKAHFNNPKLDQEPGFLLNTGEREGCVSDYGVHDLVGNLHEWVADRVDITLPQKIPLTNGIRNALERSTGKGVFLGGFFSTRDEHGQGCTFVTTAHEAAYHDYSTGFRCCRDL